MSKMSIKLNLTQLKHAVTKTSTGVEIICIPIDSNHLYKSDKGNLYLDLIAWPLKTPTKEQSHLVKQSYPKSVLDAMTDEQKKEIPIIGNVKTWDDFAGGESAPVAAAELQGGTMPDLAF